MSVGRFVRPFLRREDFFFKGQVRRVSFAVSKMGDDEFGFVSRVLAASTGVEKVDCAAAETLQGTDTRLRALVEACGDKNKAKWLGKGSLEEGLTAQWLTFKSSQLGAQDVGAALADLNKYLLGKSFLVANGHVTLADVCVFWAVQKHVSGSLLGSHPSLLRWFDQLQNWPAIRATLGDRFPLLKVELPCAWDTLESKSTAASQGGQAAKASNAKPKDGDAAKPKAQGGKAAKPKKESKEKKGAAPAPAAGSEQPEPTKLDIRVGLFTKCSKHPESDKLLIEEIDVGEDQPRPIASGIQKYYPDPEALVGRKVLVVCNLKPAKLAGFVSNGMVLCAKSDDDSQVELVEPPKDAPVGERVTFEGVEGDFAPMTPAQVKKKKVVEDIIKNQKFKTDGNRVVGWVGPDGKLCNFKTSAGIVTAPTVSNGTVS